MSKDQARKNIPFFHTNRPKSFLPDFSRVENDQTFFLFFEIP